MATNEELAEMLFNSTWCTRKKSMQVMENELLLTGHISIEKMSSKNQCICLILRDRELFNTN